MRLVSVIVAIIVGILFLGGVIVPGVQSMDFGETHDEGLTMQFDEYLPDPTVKEVTGPLETVVIDGISYVHATDLGDGTLLRYDGTEEPITVTKGKLDLFYMWGQSNAAYYGDPQPDEASPRPAPGQAYFWGLYYSKADPPTYAYAVHSSTPWNQDYIDKCRMYDCWQDGQMVIGNLLPAFAAGYVAETGHRLYWVSAAVGGTSLELFQPGQSVYQYGQTVMHAALEQVDLDKWEITPVGLGWWHGSADDKKPPQQYVDLFMGMFEAVKDGGLGIPIDHCYLSLTRSTGNPYKAHMLLGERADVTIVEDIVREFPAEEDDPSYYANNHYSQKGYNLAGYQMGTNTGKEIGHDPTPPEPPLKTVVKTIPVLVLVVLVWFGLMALTRND